MGGPELLHSLMKARCLPSYTTRRRCVVAAPEIFPNEPPTLVSLLGNVKHVMGVHVWHLLINELHVADLITVSHEACATSCYAMYCVEMLTTCSNDDVEAPETP